MNGTCMSKTLNIGLEQLHEVICFIREDLKQISGNFDYHATKYFSGYRRIDNSVEINNLKKHKKLLDKRLDLFMKIVDIEHNAPANNKMMYAEQSLIKYQKNKQYPPFYIYPDQMDESMWDICEINKEKED